MRALFTLAPCRNDNEDARCVRPPNKVIISNNLLPIFVLFRSGGRLLSLHHQSERLHRQTWTKWSIIKGRAMSALSALSSLRLRLRWTLRSSTLSCLQHYSRLLDKDLSMHYTIFFRGLTNEMGLQKAAGENVPWSMVRVRCARFHWKASFY